MKNHFSYINSRNKRFEMTKEKFTLILFVILITGCTGMFGIKDPYSKKEHDLRVGNIPGSLHPEWKDADRCTKCHMTWSWEYGYYRGWDLLHEANLAPPVTRSDWVIKDSTGAIYVSANSEVKLPEMLRPDSLQHIGTVLEVKGIVGVTSTGQPYIEAKSIERMP